MADNFKVYSLSVFENLNKELIKKASILEANEIEKTLVHLIKMDEHFADMETKLDVIINKLIAVQIMKNVHNEMSHYHSNS